MKYYSIMHSVAGVVFESTAYWSKDEALRKAHIIADTLKRHVIIISEDKMEHEHVYPA